MPMAFSDLGRTAVDFASQRVCLEAADPFAQPHCTAEFFNVNKVPEFEDHRKRGFLIKFGRVRIP